MKRRSFLDHLAWTGSGIVWTLGASGTLVATADAAPGFSFVQISDSHIGFKKEANPDVSGTLERAVAEINAMPQQPDFVIHTGDITHLSKPAEFDTAKQILGKLRAPLMAIPGEHDVIGDGAALYAQMFGHKGATDGWYSFDRGGAHFVALVNVFNFETVGKLGAKQIAWVEKDLANVKSSTPIVVLGHVPLYALFPAWGWTLANVKSSTPIVVLGHVPLYALFPAWGWTTEDGAQVLAMLARFSNVTVLNGHIHQVVTHTEGNMHFATAAATAYPQAAPGAPGAGPGPKLVPPDQLLHVLGYRSVSVAGNGTAIDDHPLG